MNTPQQDNKPTVTVILSPHEYSTNLQKIYLSTEKKTIYLGNVMYEPVCNLYRACLSTEFIYFKNLDDLKNAIESLAKLIRWRL